MSLFACAWHACPANATVGVVPPLPTPRVTRLQFDAQGPSGATCEETTLQVARTALALVQPLLAGDVTVSQRLAVRMRPSCCVVCVVELCVLLFARWHTQGLICLHSVGNPFPAAYPLGVALPPPVQATRRACLWPWAAWMPGCRGSWKSCAPASSRPAFSGRRRPRRSWRGMVASRMPPSRLLLPLWALVVRAGGCANARARTPVCVCDAHVLRRVCCFCCVVVVFVVCVCVKCVCVCACLTAAIALPGRSRGVRCAVC
jgi:hypothetical protein